MQRVEFLALCPLSRRRAPVGCRAYCFDGGRVDGVERSTLHALQNHQMTAGIDNGNSSQYIEFACCRDSGGITGRGVESRGDCHYLGLLGALGGDRLARCYAGPCCLGARLARMELPVTLEPLLERDVRLALRDTPRYMRSNFAHSQKHMPVTLRANP